MAFANAALFRSFWFWAGFIVIARIIGLMLSDSGLGPDEAQYWFWAQDLSFGYFSKPPMIAWAIAATTGIFGDGEWAVRLAAPLFHVGAAVFIYATADFLFGKRVAFFAGLGWLTLPGVGVSSFLITTDAPLLFFWSGALFFLIRILNESGNANRDFALLGLMIGFGLLSKYAMFYFPAAMIVAAMASAAIRAKIFRAALMLTALVAAVVFAPNIAWNAAHDFQTAAHTAANANWSSSLFQPVSLLEFLGAQLAVFGPVLFAGLIGAFATTVRRRPWRDKNIVLLVFTVTPLLIVSLQAFISRAHANWAAAAYPAAIILVSAFLLERRALFARASLVLNSAIAALVLVGLANVALIDRIGAGAAVAELRGWEDMTEEIAARADGYDAILFDDRSMIAEMLYYQRQKGFEIAALDPNNGVHHHFEAFLAFKPAQHQRSLFVSILPTDAHVNYRFRTIEKIGVVRAPTGGETREFTLFEISGYYGPPGVQYTD